MSSKKIFTIGHSTHEIEDFIVMLKNQKIELLVDVRSLPGSNHFPQFNKEALKVSLNQSGIEYLLLPELGGRRPKRKDSINTAWRNASFRNYADYMGTEEFQTGVEKLMQLAMKQITCIMCAEAVWWRCHRSMIADYLKWKGWIVLHILSEKKVEEHPFTSPAKLCEGQLCYTEEGDHLKKE